jgi:hypothetical protein
LPGHAGRVECAFCRLFLGQADLLQRLSALDMDTVVLALDFILSSVVFSAHLAASIVVFAHLAVVFARLYDFILYDCIATLITVKSKAGFTPLL